MRVQVGTCALPGGHVTYFHLSNFCSIASSSKSSGTFGCCFTKLRRSTGEMRMARGSVWLDYAHER